MAELLVRIVDKPWETRSWRNTNLRWAYHTKAGDVIVLKENGHAWGRKEVESDIWRIFCLPEYRMIDFLDMMEAEMHWHERVQTCVRYFDLSGPWARSLILSGGLILLLGDDAKRFINLKRTHAQAVPLMVA